MDPNNIADLIKSIALKEEELYCKLAVVESFSEQNNTCNLTPVDGSAMLLNVPILPQANGAISIIPKEGSTVLAVFLDNTIAFVVAFGEADKITHQVGESTLTIEPNKAGLNADEILFKNNTTSIKISNGPIEIKHNGQSLGEILNSLIDAILGLTVTVPSAGPSGIPNNATQFTAVKARIAQLLS